MVPSCTCGSHEGTPGLSLFHMASCSRAYQCGMGFSRPAGLGVVILLIWKLISKRNEVGASSHCHSVLPPGYSLVKAVKEPTQIQESGKINPIYATGSHCRRDKDMM